MDKLDVITTDVNAKLDWRKIYALPNLYWLVRDSHEFLLIAAWAKQRVMGVANGDQGYGVLFRNNNAIKVVYDFLEDPDEVIDWEALRKALSKADVLFYELLLEEERLKKERDEA